MTIETTQGPGRTPSPLQQVAVGLIVAEDGRVLLQHRDDRPDVLGAGLWGFFGGHVEPGERPADAFLREMQEELGWRPRHFEPFLVREVHRDGWHVTAHVFAAHLDVSAESLTLGEGQGMQLFALDAIPEATVGGLTDAVTALATSDAYKRVKHRYDAITATGILVDREGRFLVQHRDDKPDIYNPGLWGSFGGSIEPYETPGDGFLRELQEELSWQPQSFELYASGPFFDAGGERLLVYVYTARVDVPIEQLVLGEGQDMGFFALEDLPEATVPAYRTLLERFASDGAYRDMMDRARRDHA